MGPKGVSSTMTPFARRPRSGRPFALAASVIFLPTAYDAPARTPSFPLHEGPSAHMEALPVDHNIRVSIGTLDLGEDTLRFRVRVFWDDLELALMEHSSDMGFRLADEEAVHAQIGAYINTMVELEIDEARVVGELTNHGIEEARRPDEVMWWYELSYTAPERMTRIKIRNRLLFNLFEDQRNILHVTMPNGSERAYYFSWDEDAIDFPVPA